MFPPGVPPVCAIDGTLLEPKLGAFPRAFPNEKDDAAGAGLLDGAAAPNWKTPGTAVFALAAKLNPLLGWVAVAVAPAPVAELFPKGEDVFWRGDVAPNGAVVLLAPEFPNEKTPAPALLGATGCLRLLLPDPPNWKRPEVEDAEFCTGEVANVAEGDATPGSPRHF